MSKIKTVLMGYSGHGITVADAARQAGLSVNFYADRREAAQNPLGLEYLGLEEEKGFRGWNQRYGFLLGIGHNETRERIGRLIEEHGEALLKVVHPSAVVSGYAEIGLGTFISGGVCVNAMAKTGKYVILNTGCIIEHECRIGDASHIAPGAVLAGNVTVGQRTLVGANSVIREGIKIGNGVLIGAGSTIVRDIPDGKVVYGNPGRDT